MNLRRREDKGQDFLWDADAPGLAVRSTKAGSKAFIFEGRLAGKRMRITIGDVRVVGIDQARAEARRLQTLIDQGIDPRGQKAEQRAQAAAKKAAAVAKAQAAAEAERRQALRVTDGWSTYLDDRRPHWSDRHYRDHVNLAQPGGEAKKRGRGLTVAGPLAPLLALRFLELTPERIASWLETEKVARSTQTRLAFGLLKTFAGWCEEQRDYRGLIPPDTSRSRAFRTTKR